MISSISNLNAAAGRTGGGPWSPVAGRISDENEAVILAARTGSPVEQGSALRALDEKTGDRRLTDRAVKGDAAPINPAASPSCTIEVRYKRVLGPTHHAFIVTTDADSVNYFRGGPQANETGANIPSSVRGDGADIPYDPRFGIYGPIVTEYGAYRPGTSDFVTRPTGRQTVEVTPGNCDAIETEFARHLDDIEAARINYMPTFANSNSVVRETLERAGYVEVEPVIWAPAWGAQLADPR